MTRDLVQTIVAETGYNQLEIPKDLSSESLLDKSEISHEGKIFNRKKVIIKKSAKSKSLVKFTA